MKQIYYLILLASITMHAQSFPEPYCDIPNTSVEEITYIYLNDLTINNYNSEAILLDRTDYQITVEPSETFTLTVQGNTYGDFTTQFYAFIDWNQNYVLDDEGEVYDIGTISNSTGTDGITTSLDITVPDDAVNGPTRIRISKIYSDVEQDIFAVADPCAISMEVANFGINPGYGQAIDFTLQVGNLGTTDIREQELQVYPNPAKNDLFIKSAYDIKSVEIYNVLGQQVLSQNLQERDDRLDISQLDKGTYILKVQTVEDKNLSYKFIKN